MERKLEKQLNRIAFLAGAPQVDMDKRKTAEVLKSIAMQAEKMDLVIFPVVRKKTCVVCSCLDRNDDRKLDCGHFLCSFD